MAYITLTAGQIVYGKAEKGKPEGELMLHEAQSSVKDRNERAVEMGLAARYEVAGA